MEWGFDGKAKYIFKLHERALPNIVCLFDTPV